MNFVIMWEHNIKIVSCSNTALFLKDAKELYNKIICLLRKKIL